MMQSYEIRILRRDHAPITYAEPQWCDSAAIERAKHLAREQDGLEVWRDNTCLFYRNSRPALPC